MHRSVVSLRKTMFIAAALSVAGAAAPAGAALTSYLPLDGSYTDASGQGHHGSPVGNTTFSGSAPAVPGSGQSAQFDGSGDYIVLANGHTIPFGGTSASTNQPFSASAWVNADNSSTAPDGRVIISKALDNVGGNHSAALFIDGAGQLRFDNFFVNEVHGGPNLKNTGWHHTAVTFNDATNRYSLFVDGKVVAQKVFNPALPATNLTDSNWEVRIGDTKNATFPAPADLSGFVDSVATYSHQVLAPDVADLAAGRATPLTLGQATSPQSYSNLVLAKNPLAYYRFEEAVGAATALDSSGNGKHGTYTNVTLGNANPFAGLGNVADFNGSSSRVDVPSLGSSMQSTIEFWVNARSLPGGINAIYTTDSFVAGDVHYHIASDGRLEHTIGNGGPDDLFSPVTSVGLDDWYHVVTTYDATDNGRTRFYVNGLLLSEGFHANDLASVFSAANIGSFNLSRFFNGQLDEFAIYGSLLTEQEILAHLAARNGVGLAAVPEPATLSLLMLGAAGLLRRRRGAC